MAPLSQFHIRILLNGPQDARPGKFRFAYAQSPAKRTHSRESLSTGPHAQELGRIPILLPRGVYHAHEEEMVVNCTISPPPPRL